MAVLHVAIRLITLVGMACLVVTGAIIVAVVKAGGRR